MTNAARPTTSDGSAPSAPELRPPESWPGAAGRTSRAPVVPSWPGRSVPAAAGESWPGASPARPTARPADATPATPTGSAGSPGRAASGPGRRPLVAAAALAAVVAVAVVGWAFVDASHRAMQGALGGVAAVLVVGTIVAAGLWWRRGRRR